MKYIERLSQQALLIALEILLKFTTIKHIERLFLRGPDLTGYIVKECHMKYVKRLSQKVPD
jgi:hypothetical protein